jgi:hypothetical protein
MIRPRPRLRQVELITGRILREPTLMEVTRAVDDLQFSEHWPASRWFRYGHEHRNTLDWFEYVEAL